MDLSELQTADAHEAGSEVNIYNPTTGKETDIYIRVQGVDSKEYRRSAAKIRTSIMTSKVNGEDPDTVDIEIDGLVAVTLGWRGIEDKGKEYKFTKKRCKDLYTTRPYIRDQIDRFIANRANFTEG